MKPADEHARPSDLDWEAFRYVAGEMPAGEADVFELQLQNDPAACEAVVRATQLTLAARTVMDDQSQTRLAPAAGKSFSVRQSVAAAVAFAAMSLLLALLYLPERAANDPQSDAPTADELYAAAELISQWSSAAVPAVDDAGDDVSEIFSGRHEPADGADIVPAWMLVAVSLEAVGSEQEMMDELPGSASEL